MGCARKTSAIKIIKKNNNNNKGCVLNILDTESFEKGFFLNNKY